MTELTALLHYRLLGNSISEWTLAVLAFLITFTVLPLIRSFFARRARREAGITHSLVVELILRLIPRTSRLFLWILAVKSAETFLALPPAVHHALTVLVLVVVWFQIGLWAMAAVNYLLDRQGRRRGDHDTSFASSLGVINFIAGLGVWTLVALLALDNLGVNITALVAGLGVGGIAIALAVQTILGDLLASLSITLDKPFTVGDNVVVDDCSGQVEHIGIKSTRIRSVDGEQIILSNSDLLKSRLRNFGRMDERRGVMSIGITFETPRAKVAQVAGLIEQVIRSQSGVRFERCHLKDFGAYALNFEAVFFVLKPELNALMDAQHNINLGLLESFENSGIEFAYPTQKLLLTPTGKDRSTGQQETTA
jgi:small-conductance mechanosensitive channel